MRVSAAHASFHCIVGRVSLLSRLVCMLPEARNELSSPPPPPSRLPVSPAIGATSDIFMFDSQDVSTPDGIQALFETAPLAWAQIVGACGMCVGVSCVYIGGTCCNLPALHDYLPLERAEAGVVAHYSPASAFSYETESTHWISQAKAVHTIPFPPSLEQPSRSPVRWSASTVERRPLLRLSRSCFFSGHDPIPKDTALSNVALATLCSAFFQPRSFYVLIPVSIVPPPVAALRRPSGGTSSPGRRRRSTTPSRAGPRRRSSRRR